MWRCIKLTTEELLVYFIQKQISKVELGIITKEYAKGYCFGYLNAKHDDGILTNSEYDDIARIVDDKFNSEVG